MWLNNFYMINILLTTIFAFSPAWSYETHDVNCMGQKLPDIRAELNLETNRRIQSALQQTNMTSGPACPRENLTEVLKKSMAHPWTNNLETWVEKSSLVKCRVKMDATEFGRFPPKEMEFLKLSKLSSGINVAGIYFGTDKLSHFMTEGFDYWQILVKGGTEADFLAHGKGEEEGKYGWAWSGVKSYGDMYANYKGLSFWGQLFDGPKPFLKCQADGSWRQVREFDWKEYVSSGLNETINCNEYKTPEMNSQAAAFSRAHLAKRSGLDSPTCPVINEECSKIVQGLAPQIAKEIIHPRCLKAAAAAPSAALSPVQDSATGR